MTDILIFESDLDFAHALRGELARSGCEVSVVSDANVGLQQAASRPPDLILLCTELPRMNGFSVCNRLKRDPDLQNVPVIIMSANASEETFQQHRNLTKKRAQDYVHKPIAIGEMLERVGKFVPLSKRIPPGGESLEELDLDDMEEVDVAASAARAHQAAAAHSSLLPTSGLTLGHGASVPPTLVPGSNVTSARPGPPPLPNSSPPGFASSAPPLPRSSSTPPPLPRGSSMPPPLPGHNSSMPPPLPGHNSLGSAPSSAPPPDHNPHLSTPPPKPSVAPRHSEGPAATHTNGTPVAEDAAELRRSSRAARRRSSMPAPSDAPPALESIPAAAPVPSVVPVPAAPVPFAPRAPMLSETEIDTELSSPRIQELEAALAETRALLDSVYRELDEAKTKESNQTSKAKEILDLREALHSKEKELLDLRDQLTRRDKELLAAKDGMLEHERRSTTAQEAASELEKRMHAAERAQQAATQDREQANKRADGYKKKLEKTLETLEQTEGHVRDLTAAHAAESARREAAEARIQELERQLAEQQQATRDLQADLAEAEKELTGLEGQLEGLQARLTQTAQQLEASVNSVQQSQDENAQLQGRLDQYLAGKANLQHLLGQALTQLSALESKTS